MSGLLTFNTIVLSPEPRGRFIEGIIDGTPKPGTVVQLKAATEPVNGKFTFEVYNRDADGNRPQGPLFVLTEDYLQGRLVTDQFASGDLVKVYAPLPGDELMMLIADVAGTDTDTHAIGEILMVDDGTGKLVASSSPETEPFVLAETLAGLTADTLAHCFFSGY